MVEEQAYCKVGSKSEHTRSPKTQSIHSFAANTGEGCLVGSVLPLLQPHNDPSITPHNHAPTTPQIHAPSTLLTPHPKPASVTLPTGSTSLSFNASKPRKPFAANQNTDLGRKPWRSLWPHERIIVSFKAAAELGALAFTLNLSESRERSFSNHTTPVDRLRRYIARELRQTFGYLLPFAFVLESSPAGRLHAHGVIIVPEGQDIPGGALRAALARAGGKITDQGASARQIDIRPAWDAGGWARYSIKSWDETCQQLGLADPGFISNEIVRLAKVSHN